MSKVREWFNDLEAGEREAYARRVGTSLVYLRAQLIPASVPPRKVARRRRMEKMAEASDGALSMADVVAHFYPEPVHEAPTKVQGGAT